MMGVQAASAQLFTTSRTESPRMRRGSRLFGRLETMRINDLLDLGAA